MDNKPTKRGTCSICGKTRRLVVSLSWYKAGGKGEPPPDAWVCQRCENIEQRLLRQGRVEINQIWGMR